ncbi:MAG: Hsp20/alpha crystallin family protein [Pirellulales bacterium]
MALFIKKGGSLIPRRDELFAPFETAIDRMVDDFFGNDFLDGLKRARFPRLNAFERDGQWVIQAGVPGVQADDLDVEVSEGVVTISGKMESATEDKDVNYYVRELSSKSFRRQIRLPETIEGDPEAVLKDGMLTLSWNTKKEIAEEVKSRKIDVRSD